MSSSNSGSGSGLRVPILMNVLVIAVIASIVVVGRARLLSETRDAIAYTNRFITAEWQLLAAFKQQSDRDLARRDREIAALRRELEAAGSTDTAELGRALAAAYRERDAIQRELVRFDAGRRTQPPNGEPAVVPSQPAVAVPDSAPAGERPAPETVVQSPGEALDLAARARLEQAIIDTVSVERDRIASLALELESSRAEAADVERDLLARIDSLEATLDEGALEAAQRTVAALEDDLEASRARVDRLERALDAGERAADQAARILETTEAARTAAEAERDALLVSRDRLEAERAAREGEAATQITSAVDENRAWTRTAIGVVAGTVEASDPRFRQVSERAATDEAFRETVWQLQALAGNRTVIAAPQLIGAIGSTDATTAEVQLLVAGRTTEGSAVQIRRPDGTPLGRLVATGTVSRVDSFSATIAIGDSGAVRTADRVFSTPR